MVDASSRTNGLTVLPRPQSPQQAGFMTSYAGTTAPSGWLELNGQTIVGADVLYPDLFANAPAAWKSGSDLTLPNGDRRTEVIDLSVLGLQAADVNGGEERGYAYQKDGIWHLKFWIYRLLAGTRSAGLVDSSNIEGVIFRGVISGEQQPVTTVDSASTVITGGYVVGNNNIVRMMYKAAGTSASNDYKMHGDVMLASKPTDDFVNADARFSSFDEALTSMPIIKLYNDDASAATIGVAAASAVDAGVLKLNKIQTKLLTSIFTTNNGEMTDITFNNLVVGNWYTISGIIYMRLDGATGVVSVEIRNGTDLLGLATDSNTSSGNTHLVRKPVSITFKATDPKLDFTTISLATGVDAIIGDNTKNGTFISLEERNDIVATTEF